MKEHSQDEYIIKENFSEQFIQQFGTDKFERSISVLNEIFFAGKRGRIEPDEILDLLRNIIVSLKDTYYSIFSMNYSLFSIAFKQYAQVNFVNYLKTIRMKEAKRLLETSELKILDISKAVGYENEKHFMKLFKEICGVSPSEYRKNNMK